MSSSRTLVAVPSTHVDGTPVALHGSDRFNNRFGTTAFGDTTVEIADGPARLTLDLARGRRSSTR